MFRLSKLAPSSEQTPGLEERKDEDIALLKESSRLGAAGRGGGRLNLLLYKWWLAILWAFPRHHAIPCYGQSVFIWTHFEYLAGAGGGGALTCLHSGGQHGFPSVFMLSSKMEMWPQFASSPNEIPFPPVLVAGQKSVLLQWRSPSLPTDRRPISLPTCSLACRLPPSESPALLASLQRKLPASHSPYYPAILTMLSLGPFLVSSSHSPALPCPLFLFLLARPSLLAMFCLLLSLPLSPLWTWPAASGCPLPNNYNKNLVLHHAMEPSCHWFTQYMTRPNLPTSEGVISILLNWIWGAGRLWRSQNYGVLGNIQQLALIYSIALFLDWKSFYHSWLETPTSCPSHGDKYRRCD